MEEKARREKEEIRLALAKAYFESKIENTDDFFASLLLLFFFFFFFFFFVEEQQK